jgi:hypothetical protein
MKKVSVYFTDPQSEALEAKAAQAGITFAEALRRALDEWLQRNQGGAMTDERPTTLTPTAVTTVYVNLGEEGTLTYRNAELIADYDGNITVWRGERQLASFSARDVSSWYLEEPEDA